MLLQTIPSGELSSKRSLLINKPRNTKMTPKIKRCLQRKNLNMTTRVLIRTHNGLDCEHSLSSFGIVEGSARFAIARLRAARNEGASPRKVKITFLGLAPSFFADRGLAARSLANANRALPSTIPKKNNDCSQSNNG